MPGYSPIHNLPYPLEGDPIYKGASVIKALALALDTALTSAGQASPTGVPLIAANCLRTSHQSIPNGAITMVTWQSGQWDARPSGASAQYSTSGLTARIKGLYQLEIAFAWDYTTSTTGDRVAYLYKNGTTNANIEELDGRRARVIPGEHVNRISTQIYLVPGDLLRLGVYQSSGAALGGGGAVIGNTRGRMAWTYLGNPL